MSSISRYIGRQVAWLLALVLFVPVLRAQEPAIDPEARDTQTWLQAVERHVPGQRDASVEVLARWSRSELDDVLGDVGRLEPDERLGVVRRALVLHTDIAVLNRTATGYTLPADNTATELFADGRQVAQMFGTFHWGFSRRLLERLPRGDERTALGLEYYRATTATLQLWGEHAELEPHVAAGKRLVGDDPVLLLYEATLHQMDADPRAQRYYDELRRERRDRAARGAGGGGMRGRMSQVAEPPSETAARAEAERLLKRALSEDPDLHEARIRLAHMLNDRGRSEEAVDALEPLPPARDLPPFLGYYASLVDGRVNRSLDRLDAARAAFEQALALAPRAQAPRVALSELAMAAGDRATALRYLMPLAAPGLSDEPWWLTSRVHAPTAQERIEGFRRSVQ